MISISPAVPPSIAIVLATGEGKCLFSQCNAKGALQAFKTMAMQKIAATSKIKHDQLNHNSVRK